MDFERGMEFVATKPEETGESRVEKTRKDSSYSEEEQAKIVEDSNQDTKQTGNKRKRVVSLSSRKEKIIKSYRANLEKIFQLVETISTLEGQNYRQEEQIVEEIKKIRHLQEELLTALILEQKGALTPESVSEETWILIEEIKV